MSSQCVNHNLMQQQIQADPPEDILPELNELIQPPEMIHHDDELISQHYEEDFDPVQSYQTIQPDPEIKEELFENEQNRVEQRHRGEPGRQEDQQEGRIRKECREMEQQIAALQSQLDMHGKKPEEDEQTEQNSQNVYEQLKNMKMVNQDELDKQSNELQQTITSKFGRNTLSMNFLLQEEQMVGGEMLEERLIQQMVRVNALLHCASNQIARMQREVKKNGEVLETAEEDKQEMHKKYRGLYREGEEKKDRLEKNSKKIDQLDEKISGLVSKMPLVEVKKIPDENPQQKRWQQKWQGVNQAKQTADKKIALIVHSTQNSAHSLTRIILDLKKQRQEVQVNIEQIQAESTELQQRSEAILDSYHNDDNRNKRNRCKNRNHFSSQPQEQYHYRSESLKSPSMSSANNISVMRKRNFSVQKKPMTISNRSSIHNLGSESVNPYMGLTGAALDAELSAHDSLLSDLQSKLKECSTDGALRKQFKLKLPKNHIPQVSKKYIDLSSIASHKEAPSKIFISKNPASKLSIPERIQRIEVLEKEDRVHSNKLSSSRVTPKANLSLIEPPQLQADLDIIPALQQQRQQQKQLKKPKPRDQCKNSPKSKIKIMNISKTEDSPIQSNKTSISLIPKNPFAQMQLPKPQNLFSSIKQKLQMRESSARMSFQLQQPEQMLEMPIQILSSDKQIMSMSRLSRQSLMLKKRETIRERKITDQYMKVLEERGRQILQLDNENDI